MAGKEKVYIVSYWGDYEGEILGVFSTAEKAQAYQRFKYYRDGKIPSVYHIDEFEVDGKDIEGEEELMFLVRVDKKYVSWRVYGFESVEDYTWGDGKFEPGRVWEDKHYVYATLVANSPERALGKAMGVIKGKLQWGNKGK